MQHLLDENQEDRRSVFARVAIFTGAVAATAAVVALVLTLGNWAYRFRLVKTHENRLTRLLPQKPTLEQIIAGLYQEKMMLIAELETREELERVIAELAKEHRGLVLARADGWKKTRVFRAGDVVYFVFFDETNVMRSFACVVR